MTEAPSDPGSDRLTLRVEGLRIAIPDQSKLILDDFHWEWEPGGVYGLIGESGSGKTTLGLSLFGILPPGGIVGYRSFTLLGRDYRAWEREKFSGLRGKRIGLIPQNPHLAFHPYRRLGDQVLEFYRWIFPPMADRGKILTSWEEFGLRSPESAFQSYPSQLSGGEKQRICIALVHHSPAECIIADEPTTALDPIQERKIVSDLLRSVRELGKTLLVISHDLPLVSSIAQEVMVIKSGKMVEKNTKRDGGFAEWQSSYAQELMKVVARPG